jgi:hypothetical protein
LTYEEGSRMGEEKREIIRTVFDLGIGVELALGRVERQQAAGIAEEPYEAEMVFLQTEPDSLAHLDLPLRLGPWFLARDDVRGYSIRHGSSADRYEEIKLTAEGTTANIWSIVKSGRLGVRQVKVPHPKLVEALRDLGFEEMVWPNGKRYRVSSWGGLGGIRRVKE